MMRRALTGGDCRKKGREEQGENRGLPHAQSPCGRQRPAARRANVTALRNTRRVVESSSLLVGHAEFVPRDGRVPVRR